MSSLFGYAVASEVELCRLAPEAGSRGLLSVSVTTPNALPVARARLASFGTCTLARTGDGPLIACRAAGMFSVEPAARRVRVAVAAGCSPAALEHRIVATAVPLLASELGDAVLHASAVVGGGGAVLFCGPSGRGKSTLARASGLPVVAEDGAVLAADEPGEPALVWPGPTGVRVREPAGTRVVRAPRNAFPVPARAVVLLAPRGGRRVRAEPVSPAEAAVELVSHVMTAVDPILPTAFRVAAGLADTIPAFRGRVPDDLAAAPAAARELVAAVEQHVQEHHPLAAGIT